MKLESYWVGVVVGFVLGMISAIALYAYVLFTFEEVNIRPSDIYDQSEDEKEN